MIIYMSNIICVTNRKLCNEPFLDRISKLAEAPIEAILLREKDLSEQEYLELAKDVLEICSGQNKPLIIHNFPNVAIELGVEAFHAPLHVVSALSESQRAKFKILGASCHSVEDAKKAYELGCTYITAGHVFETDCKKGLPGRGAAFVKDVVSSVPIPVYGIGGIDKSNVWQVLDAGALGIALMSSMMTCENPDMYVVDLAM